jgi:hypothetical protein
MTAPALAFAATDLLPQKFVRYAGLEPGPLIQWTGWGKFLSNGRTPRGSTARIAGRRKRSSAADLESAKFVRHPYNGST